MACRQLSVEGISSAADSIHYMDESCPATAQFSPVPHSLLPESGWASTLCVLRAVQMAPFQHPQENRWFASQYIVFSNPFARSTMDSLHHTHRGIEMKLLHLDSSLLGPASVSRRLTLEIVARQKVLNPSVEVVSRDLASDPAMHLSSAHMAAWQGVPSEDATINADLLKGNAYMDELIAADVLVIGAPMYNLTIPTPLKAWIDRISVAGKTFQYTATGPEGLLKNKKAYIASARGGVYSAGSPAAGLEHQESYLIGLLAFLGIADVTVIRAEGIAFGPEAKEAALARALDEISAIAV